MLDAFMLDALLFPGDLEVSCRPLQMRVIRFVDVIRLAEVKKPVSCSAPELLSPFAQ